MEKKDFRDLLNITPRKEEQRKNHKLKEDWGTFCKWIESLPYAKELIICE